MQPGFISRIVRGFRLTLFAVATLFFTASQGLAQPAAPAKQTQEEFAAEVRKNFEQENFAALDAAADQARTSKERFPGADWKLFVFYQALMWPASGSAATDQHWKEHLGKLKEWTKQPLKFETARIALAGSLVEYAKLARRSDEDWRGFGKNIGGKEYRERLRQAEEALGFNTKSVFTGATSWLKREITQKPDPKLPSFCPHWYYVALALQQGRPFDEWKKYYDALGNGMALEPTYHYLYQIRAVDLLPQNYGVKDQWENFAEDAAKQVGGKEGDILFYLIVSYVQPRYRSRDGHGDFFRDNKIIWGQMIANGYKQLEESYGTSKFRLNEMALLASKAQQFKVAKDLFDRIGDDWDERVWERQAAFEGYRNMAKAKAPSVATKLKSDLVGLRATLTSRQTTYPKGQDAVIEAVIEYPVGTGEADSAYEVGVVAFSLAIRGSGKAAKEITLLPQADESQATKRIEQGGSIRLTYKINFALAAGEYKLKLKSVASNELTIRIGGAAKR